MKIHWVTGAIASIGVSLWILSSGCSSKPLFPIGVYGAPKAQLVRVKAAGFNVVVGQAESTFLHSAQKAGLRVLAHPGTAAGPGFDATAARRAIEAFDRHPALWAWYLSDEPDLHHISPSEIQAAHGFVKNCGAKKPTALVVYQGAETENYSAADILMVDRYPIGWLPLENFPQHVRLARLGAGPKKPLMAVIQTFDWRTYPELGPESANHRAPAEEEMRCMVYCALARKANGIFFYAYDDGHWSLEDHPETWQAVQRVVREIGERMPLFTARHLWLPLRHEFVPAEAGFNAALESSVIPALLEVKNGTAQMPSGIYFLAVNCTDRSFEYRNYFPGIDTLPVFGERRIVSLHNGRLSDRFGPYQIHLYGPFPPNFVREGSRER